MIDLGLVRGYLSAGHAAWPRGPPHTTTAPIHQCLSPTQRGANSRGTHQVAAPRTLSVELPAPHARHAPLRACGAYRPSSHCRHSDAAPAPPAAYEYSPALQSSLRVEQGRKGRERKGK